MSLPKCSLRRDAAVPLYMHGRDLSIEIRGNAARSVRFSEPNGRHTLRVAGIVRHQNEQPTGGLFLDEREHRLVRPLIERAERLVPAPFRTRQIGYYPFKKFLNADAFFCGNKRRVVRRKSDDVLDFGFSTVRVRALKVEFIYDG